MNKEITQNGLWTNNVALVQLLGLCPLLAVTNNTINIPIKKDISMFGEFDSIIITNMEDMHSRYNELVKIVPKSKIIVPKILGGNDRGFF